MLRSRRAASGRPASSESDTFEVETPGDAALDELNAGIVTQRAKSARPAHPAVDGGVRGPRALCTLRHNARIQLVERGVAGRLDFERIALARRRAAARCAAAAEHRRGAADSWK